MASAQSNSTAKKDEVASESKPEQQTAQQKPAAALEEDDEFEDFPVDGMSSIQPLSPLGCGLHLAHGYTGITSIETWAVLRPFTSKNK